MLKKLMSIFTTSNKGSETDVKSEELEISSVKRLKEGAYLINDAVIIADMDVDKSGEIVYDMTFDPDLVSEEDANKITNLFIREALFNKN